MIYSDMEILRMPDVSRWIPFRDYLLQLVSRQLNGADLSIPDPGVVLDQPAAKPEQPLYDRAPEPPAPFVPQF
ncbi:MAG: hypothetical protein TR69_WS6001001363 [candidate division WS6 bacterium OLB20]|uniref:Uncharacterized protein n=1 Tax=candidate division WS6 bacterium OLB20 TaxID=1617426 RepID=A0A136LWP4_9BACT|nr:MAG: hypothetical protein TR69_WS6001001363 [candidate division WS6 bacterium OLB20]